MLVDVEQRAPILARKDCCMQLVPSSLPVPRPGHRVDIGADDGDETAVCVQDDTASHPFPSGPSAWGYHT